MAVEYDPNGTPILTNDSLISDVPPYTQALAAASIMPVGAIMPYMGTAAPDYWLICDGSQYDPADLPELAAVNADFHEGEKPGEFRVPDLRGRSPIGTCAVGVGDSDFGPTGKAALNFNLGTRYGDKRVGNHLHQLVGNNNAQIYVDTGDVTTGSPGPGEFSVSQLLTGPLGYHTPNAAGHNEMVATSAARRGAYPPAYGLGDQLYNNGGVNNGMAHGIQGNMSPVTSVNFIVYAGRPTAGITPVPGGELAPVTTRMMIEARLAEAGIGEEEVKMLKEQLETLKEQDA